LRHEEEEEKEGCVSVSAFKRWWGGELRSADLDETSGDGVPGDGEGLERRSPSGAVELAQVRVDVEAERGES
jgi:hypothetical protein